MSKGEAAFVLPQCENLPYISIEEGDMFGILDLVPETKETVIDQEIQRNFTVMALDYSDILCLSLEVIFLLTDLCSIYKSSTKVTRRLWRRFSSRLASVSVALFERERKQSSTTS